MARVYLDEDVWLRLRDDLQREGHDVVVFRDYGLVGASDALHLRTAAQEDSILLTCNRKDFQLLHDAWLYWSALAPLPPHPGIIIADQTLTRQAHVSIIVSLLNGVSEFKNRAYEWIGSYGGAWYRYEAKKWDPLGS